MSYQYILVSLREFGDITALKEIIRSQDGVARIGAMEYDKDQPEIPPYFFVYVAEDTDLQPICEAIKKDPLVKEAAEPPARYAV